MNFLDSIDPKVKLGFSLAAVIGIVIAFVVSGNAREEKGVTSERNRWLLEIANRPVERETTWVHDTIPGEIQWMSGRVILDTSAHRALESAFDRIEELEDSLHTKFSASTTLHDSLGGKHELSYTFSDNTLREKYTPAAGFRDLMRIRERQEIPYELKRIWMGGLSFEFHHEPGFGPIFGVKPLVLGVSYFPGSNTFLYRAQALWEF